MPHFQQDAPSDGDERTPQHAPGQGSAGSGASAPSAPNPPQGPSPRRRRAVIKDEHAQITKSATLIRGVYTYGGLNDSFAKAYNRTVGSIGKEAFQMQVLQKFPLVLTTQSAKDIASGFGFDEACLIPPANKRTRAQQAIANTQHIGLMLRQGLPAQIGVQSGAQQHHGVSPQVLASMAAPMPAAPPVPVVATPATPGNDDGQQVIQAPQTPVPNRRRLPPGTPLALMRGGAAASLAPAASAMDAVANPAVAANAMTNAEASAAPIPAVAASAVDPVASAAASPAVVANAMDPEPL
eukprot:s2232_g15.t1